MFFSSFVLIECSKLVPKGLLGRLTDADFLQQIEKNLQTCGRHMPELVFVKFANRLVEGFQKAECLRRDARLHDAAVVGLAYPGNQSALFQAIEEARHVRVVGDHAVTDAPAGQSFGLGAAKNTKDIVLRARKSRRSQKRFPREMTGLEDLEREFMM